MLEVDFWVLIAVELWGLAKKKGILFYEVPQFALIFIIKNKTKNT